jgi:hypothetical protein
MSASAGIPQQVVKRLEFVEYLAILQTVSTLPTPNPNGQERRHH